MSALGRPLRGSLLVVSGPETLAASLEPLAAQGVRVNRWVVLRPVARPQAPRLPLPQASASRNVLLVSSRQSAKLYLARFPKEWARWVRDGEIWAVGPTTRQSLVELGAREVKSTPTLGTSSLLRSLGPLNKAFLVYPRSRRAGPGLARALRRRGAKVRDLVAYELRSRRALSAHQRSLLETSDAVLFASPSAMEAFRRLLGPSRFREARQRRAILVLGPRTRARARELGFGRVSQVSLPFEKGFTSFLAKRGRNGPQKPAGFAHRPAR